MWFCCCREAKQIVAHPALLSPQARPTPQTTPGEVGQRAKMAGAVVSCNRMVELGDTVTFHRESLNEYTFIYIRLR